MEKVKKLRSCLWRKQHCSALIIKNTLENADALAEAFVPVLHAINSFYSSF